VVSVRVALSREATVGSIARIADDLFRRLDRQEPPRLRVVLIPRDVRPVRRILATDPSRPADHLPRAA
jgi:hypothetical protein